MILADNFSILLGRIEVTVPWVTEGDDYIVVREYLIRLCHTLPPIRLLTVRICSIRRLR